MLLALFQNNDLYRRCEIVKAFTRTCLYKTALPLTGLLISLIPIMLPAEQNSIRHYPITTVHFPQPTPEQENGLIARANQLRGESIRKEFAGIDDIDRETMDFFVNFSAMTLAFYKREALNGVQQLNGKDDVWRMYYGGGAAAHALFPEYFRLKREGWRRTLYPERDDIAYHELTPALRREDHRFMTTAASHRREGLNPDYTSYWNNKTLKEFQDYVLVLDKDAATLFAGAFVGSGRLPDFTRADKMADAIIRHEDRTWLLHHLNLTQCSLNSDTCELPSLDFQLLYPRLQAVKSDKVFAHYFPEFVNSICDPKEKSCNWHKILSELVAITQGDKEDARIPGTLMVGWFYDFEWQGDLSRVPLTRQLSSMNLESLRTVYKGLLHYRAFWRYTQNETMPDANVAGTTGSSEHSPENDR